MRRRARAGVRAWVDACLLRTGMGPRLRHRGVTTGTDRFTAPLTKPGWARLTDHPASSINAWARSAAPQQAPIAARCTARPGARPHRGGNLDHGVPAAAVDERLALLVHHALLHALAAVVQSDENGYSFLDLLLLDGFKLHGISLLRWSNRSTFPSDVRGPPHRSARVGGGPGRGSPEATRTANDSSFSGSHDGVGCRSFGPPDRPWRSAPTSRTRRGAWDEGQSPVRHHQQKSSSGSVGRRSAMVRLPRRRSTSAAVSSIRRWTGQSSP